ncbi:V-type ATPase 116 kDa subunit [Ignisphaera aggregans DSM 17230]|uniref:A-type ATP synthase subunit I n=1 Tax=Ignisphaera aggregans (strain DSM 17230 / JCM 13409 / AQ1.S1) TaxID=583356 RepID=E0SNN5_IGNAA|nr:V-type ATPase 116 kDa subunit [Ignisphaera aggregans DSM 17230]
MLRLARIRYLILSSPSHVYKLYIVVPRDESLIEKISMDLMKLGCFEVITPSKEKMVREVKELSEYVSLLEEAKRIYDAFIANLENEIIVEIKYTLNPDEFRYILEKEVEKLRDIVKDIESINTEINSINTSITELQLVREHIASIMNRYGDTDTSILKFYGTLLSIDTFYVPQYILPSIEKLAIQIIARTSSGEISLLTAVFDSKTYNTILKSYRQAISRPKIIENLRPSTLSRMVMEIDSEIATKRDAIQRLLNEKRRLLSNYIDDIAILRIVLDNEYEKVKLIENVTRSKYLALVIGYVPETRIDDVKKYLSSYPMHIASERTSENIVEFNNLRPFKPYELITELYGVPSPSEWDPTPLIAYAFTLFFSLMFADIGYGIGLILASKYILPKLVDDPTTEGFRKFQRMLYILAGGGIVIGFLAKSFLGDLLGKYIPIPQPIINTTDVLFMIGLSLIVGLIWITIAHVIALAKAIIGRDLGGTLLESGIILILVFGSIWAADYIHIDVGIFKNYMSIIKVMVGIGIVMLIVGRVKSIGSIGGFLWIFDITGVMSDVLSFMRIAGVGSASALLAVAFNGMIYGVYTSYLALNIVIAIALGVILGIVVHLFLFMMYPLGPFVHSLRLCFYEILTKFYEGGGRRLNPIRVSIKPKLTLTPTPRR